MGSRSIAKVSEVWVARRVRCVQRQRVTNEEKNHLRTCSVTQFLGIARHKDLAEVGFGFRKVGNSGTFYGSA